MPGDRSRAALAALPDRITRRSRSLVRVGGARHAVRVRRSFTPCPASGTACGSTPRSRCRSALRRTAPARSAPGSPRGAPETARRFARNSAIGAPGVGTTGQVIYHLLAAAHAARGSVAGRRAWCRASRSSTLGFGAALAHLLRRRAGNPGRPRQSSWAVPADVVGAAKASLRATVAAGNPLWVNQLQERFSLSRRAATEVRNDVLAESNGHAQM